MHKILKIGLIGALLVGSLGFVNISKADVKTQTQVVTFQNNAAASFAIGSIAFDFGEVNPGMPMPIDPADIEAVLTVKTNAPSWRLAVVGNEANPTWGFRDTASSDIPLSRLSVESACFSGCGGAGDVTTYSPITLTSANQNIATSIIKTAATVINANYKLTIDWADDVSAATTNPCGGTGLGHCATLTYTLTAPNL